MERYYEYKDSGIEWIGEIPSNWSISPAKAIWSVRKEFSDKTTSSDKLLSVSEYYGVAPRSTKIDSEETLMRADSLEGYQFCYPGDLVMNIMLAWKGAHGVSDYSGVVSPAYAVYKQKDLEIAYPKFMHYLLRCDMYKTVFKRWSTGIIDSRLRLYPDVFMRIPIILPPLKTQKIISEYLDSKTAEIDSLIEKTERSIELLEEYRKSVISEAVTKGLDPNAPMKDSGIEWIGEIPAHWMLVPISLLTSKIGSGKTPKGGSQIYKEEGVLFLRSQNIYDSGLELADPTYISPIIDEEMANTRVYFGDVLLNITGGSIGRCCVYDLEQHANVNQHVCILRPLSAIKSKYLQFLWNSSLGTTSISVCQMGQNRESVNFEQIGAIRIPLPPIDEQIIIVSKLSESIGQIEESIINKKALVSLLSEYRKSLISEAVTGKFKVPGVE